MLREEKLRENWSLIEQRNREAQRDGYWIESICLSYMMLEGAFWVLLEKKGVSDEEIDRQKFLIKTAKFARDEGYINGDIYKRVQEFNDTRRLIIHRFVRGEISYKAQKPALRGVNQLFHDILEA